MSCTLPPYGHLPGHAAVRSPWVTPEMQQARTGERSSQYACLSLCHSLAVEPLAKVQLAAHADMTCNMLAPKRSKQIPASLVQMHKWIPHAAAQCMSKLANCLHCFPGLVTQPRQAIHTPRPLPHSIQHYAASCPGCAELCKWHAPTHTSPK
jgi:hypothetical protein